MADRRSRRQKLLDLIDHPRTPENERQAARLALSRLGEPEPKKAQDFFRAAARQTVTGTYNATFSASQTFWEELFGRPQPPPTPPPRYQPPQSANVPPCPGCGHPESGHVSFRCYACADPDERPRPKACGYIYVLVRPVGYRWIKLSEADVE